VSNCKAELLIFLGETRDQAGAEPMTRAVDLNVGGVAALCNALLVNHELRLFHMHCCSRPHAHGARSGSGKAHANDAIVIAG
jgi:hypothetical protein